MAAGPIDPAAVRIGTIVRTWYQSHSGKGGTDIILGIVVERGPKAFTVLWPSTTVARIRYDDPRGVEVEVAEECLEDPMAKRLPRAAAKWKQHRRDKRQTRAALRRFMGGT